MSQESPAEKSRKIETRELKRAICRNLTTMFTELLLLILVATVHAFRQLEDERRGEIEERRAES